MSDSSEPEIIDCTPHHATLTSVAEYYEHASGRKPLPFALSEKIDNSISATSGNTKERGRRVDAYLLYDESDVISHVAVADNGSGMDHYGLKAYMTLSYSQRSRKQDMENGRCKEGELPVALEDQEQSRDDPRWSINGNIGHFGVGGQHAAFYIGQQEHIMTKTFVEMDRKLPHPVHDIVMSAETMDEKWSKGENPYRITKNTRKERDTSCLSAETEAHPFLRELVEGESQDRHETFTVMIMSQLHDKVKTFLNPDGGDEAAYKQKLDNGFVEELARIYHYFTHGKEGTDDLPAVATDEDEEEADVESDPDSTSDAEEGVGGKRKRSEANGGSTPRGKKTARQGAFAQDSYAQVASRARDVKVEIVVHAIKAQGDTSRTMYRMSLADVPSVEVQLFRAQKSCHSVFLSLDPNKRSGGKGNSEPSSRASLYLYYCPYILNQETRPNDQFENKEDILISCYWQGRWVPYAEISSLAIFEKLDKKERQLLRRVRGTIFFERQILPNNSKLEFQQNVQELLNDHTRCKAFQKWESMDGTDQRRAVHNDVARWIRECHRDFDREILVEDIDGPAKDKPGCPGQKETKFKKMLYGNQAYLPGHKMHVKTTKPHQYGIIEYFLCDNDIAAQDEPVTGTATIFYKRFPEELFGDKLYSKPVSPQLLEPVDAKMWEDKVKECRSKLPCEMVVVKALPEGKYFLQEPKPGKKLRKGTDDIKENLLFETDLAKGVIQAGYDIPPVNVFVLSQKGNVIIDFQTANDKASKIRVADRITWTHKWVHGKFVELEKHQVLAGGHSRTRAIAESNGSFFLDQLGDAFLGAGKYELSYQIPVSGSDEILKNLQKTCTKKLTVNPGPPKEAQFFTKHLSNVLLVDAGELALGAKRKEAIRFLITDGVKDSKQPKWTRGNNCLLRSTELESLKLEADISSPPDSGLQIHFHDIISVKDAPSEYQTILQVKLAQGADSANQESSIRALLAKQKSVEVRCKLRIKITGDGGKITEVTTTNELTFKLKAGDPCKLVFDESFSGDIVIQNFQKLPPIPLKAVDRYGNVVNFDGTEKEKLILEEELIPGGDASADIKSRKIEKHTMTVNANNQNLISVFNAGGRSICLEKPCVSRIENHSLRIKAKYGGKELDCDDVDVEVRINPSNLPHSVKPVWDDGEITHKGESDWHIRAPAGSQVCGVYFKVLDEADEEVKDLSGWTVKWRAKEKPVEFTGVDSIMPPATCRDKAGDVTELTIVFTGKKSRDGDSSVVPRHTVSLTLEPFPTVPAMWKLIKPDGSKLDEVLNITCGVPLRECLAIQLLDEYNNVIDLSKPIEGLSAGDPKLSPSLFFITKTRSCDKQIIKRGDYERFDSSNPSKILPAADFCVLGTAGEWQVMVRAAQGGEAKKIKADKHKVCLKAGRPSALKMDISGLPTEQEVQDEKELAAHSYEAVSSQDAVPVLTGLPSTCTIKLISISVLDEVGNALDREAISKHLRSKNLFLKLKNGKLGPEGGEVLSKPFTKFTNKQLIFKNLKLRAGKDAEGVLIKHDELVLSSDHEPFQSVRVPLEFSPSSAVVSVKISPDPYPLTFRIGSKLKAVEVVLTTEDGSTVEGNWKDGLSIQCLREESGRKKAEADVFQPAEPDEVFTSDEAQGAAGGAAATDRRNTFHFMPGEGVLRLLKLHKIKVQWKEVRDSVISLGGATMVESNPLSFFVHPGAPHWLKDQDKKAAHDRRKDGGIQTVSNKRGMNTIVSSLRLQLLDREMNPCTRRNAYIAATLEFVGNPGFEEAEQDTLAISHDHEFLFMNDWEIHDQKEQERMNLAADIHGKEHELWAIPMTKQGIKEEQMRCQNSITYFQNKCKELFDDPETQNLLGNAQEVLGMTQQELERDSAGIPITPTFYYLREPGHCDIGIARMQQPRPNVFKIPKDYNDMATDMRVRYPNDVIGLVIELIWMENRRHAEAVSRNFRSNLLTLIVTSYGIAQEIRKTCKQRGMHVRVMALDSISRPWEKIQSRAGGSTRLLFCHDQRTRWKTDCAIVNEIQFHNPRHEHLRASALSGLFRGSCIIQTHELAKKLIAGCKQFRESYPDMHIAEDFSKVCSNGVQEEGGLRRDDIVVGVRDLRNPRIEKLKIIKTAMQTHLNKKEENTAAIEGFQRRILEQERREQDLRAEIAELRDRLDRANDEEHRASQSKDGEERKPIGFVEPELVDGTQGAGAGRGAGGAGGFSGAVAYKFDKDGLADVRNLCVRAHYGDKNGAYRLRLQARIAMDDGTDVPLEREYADKRF